jgi:hypothetical protein
MAAGSTYTPIATQTLGSNTTTVTFSSIAGTYTDLILIVQGKDATTTDAFTIQLNGDTATNYSMTAMQGNGSSASSFRDSSQNFIQNMLVMDTTAVANGTFHFMNYANTTTYKTILCRGDLVDFATRTSVGLWRSTSAITSIAVKMGSSQFATGSTFTLYGIAAA